MIINSKGAIIQSDDFTSVKSGNCIHFFRGLIYMREKKAGVETVFNIAEIYDKTGVIPFENIYGAYLYVIRNPDGKITTFSDNSNLSCFYMGKNAISSSFLSLIEYEKSVGTKLELNKESVCESLTLGKIYFDKTLVDKIWILKSAEFIEISNGAIHVAKKNIGGIDAENKVQSLQDFFDNLAYSLSGLKVCQGLTGGYDSRMIFACLKARINVVPFISGDKSENKEITTAIKVAETAGKHLDLIETRKPEITEDILESIFREHDGMYPFADDSVHRIRYFRKERREKGFQVYLTGDGGVLHKDWEWMQDLPFYNRKHTNIKKFYKQRIAFLTKKNFIGEQLKGLYITQEIRFVNQLKKYVKSTNTQSYDNLYYFVTGNRAIYYNQNPQGLLNYAPLTELDVVRYSYHLPRHKRFFFNSMRKVITKADVNIARISTVYGTTASSEKRYVLRDIFYQLVQYFIKACRLIGRKLFKKTFFITPTVSWTTEEEVRSLPVTKKAIEFAVLNGFISPNTLISNLSFAQLSSVLHIYFVSKKILL